MASSSPFQQLSYKGIVVDFVDRWIREPIARRLSSPPPPLTEIVAAPELMASGYSTLVLPDGAKLAYEVQGSYHLGRSEPIVLICGMTSARIDFERLTQCLVKTHPVLIYDHRGIGSSSLSPGRDEEISIELYARDLLALLTHLRWKEVALCGFSMGGVIAQQMLLFPYHASKPTQIPFRVTHLILAGTRSVVTVSAGLKIAAPAPNTKRTLEERIAIARRVCSALVDPVWIEANPARFDLIFKRATNPAVSRPTDIIVKQGIALQKFDFVDLLDKLPRDIQIMVIHGQLDQVIPFHCGEEVLKRIPWARLVDEGNQPGQVPSLKFGHFWYEYFDIQVWHDVIDTFIATGVSTRVSA
ncbi:Alpha/Beta hydrolase protein [Crassisporium funariophilum]|nr:Alpha/Beta hydrolase protein [Crassisporium funariophilum]